jgi:hypothetical protein
VACNRDFQLGLEGWQRLGASARRGHPVPSSDASSSDRNKCLLIHSKISYTDTCLKPGSKPGSKPTRVSRFRQHASVGRPLQDLEDSKIVSLFSIMSVADHLF